MHSHPASPRRHPLLLANAAPPLPREEPQGTHLAPDPRGLQATGASFQADVPSQNPSYLLNLSLSPNLSKSSLPLNPTNHPQSPQASAWSHLPWGELQRALSALQERGAL